MMIGVMVTVAALPPAPQVPTQAPMPETAAKVAGAAALLLSVTSHEGVRAVFANRISAT